MRHGLKLFLAVLVVAAGMAGAQPWVPDPLEPVSSGGLQAVDRALARLSVHARLLVVGAHPDDEDNALLTWVARSLGGEAAYLSLSRGEGGQNLIGPELGVELGAIRTGELLAARRLEGSRQYFTRAFDFGYTRSLDETFERWPRQVLQEDAIRVARRFKPQVVVAVFPASERAGHGQHQASAVIAADLFRLAGDGDVLDWLPDPPWSPTSLYRRAWMHWGEDATHEFSLAALDPISGRSLGQLAAASRSFHRSQDMGREQLAGPVRGGLVWIAGGRGGPGDGPFAGVDTRLAAILETVPAGPLRDDTAELLGRVEEIARRARQELSPAAVDSAVAALAEVVDLLRRSETLLADAGPAAAAARALVAEKLEVAGYGLAAAAGAVVEVVADRETVAAGGELQIEASLWRAGGERVRVSEATPLLADGWSAEPSVGDGLAEPSSPFGLTMGGEGIERWRFRVSVPASAPPTVPYYLGQARLGDLYDWRGVADAVRGEPLGPPPVRVRFSLVVQDRPVELVREAVYRYADQAFGERRRPVRAVPPVEVTLEPELTLLPEAAGGPRIRARVRSNLSGATAGRLQVAADGLRIGGEPAVADWSFSIASADRSESRTFAFDPPPPGRYRVEATVGEADGRRAAGALRSIAYPHVRPLAVPVPAAVEVRRLELTLPAMERVGYVRGASDRVPEILAAVGVPVQLLDGDDLERGELDRFDAILIGGRAYEVDPALRRANERLLDYARAGGLLIVQYQQYQFVRGGYAPFPLEILRPHGRVTDETAPVRAAAPEHSVFHRPNRITEQDWQGWVQERGLYFAGTWDERYVPLLEMADPGREAEGGSLLVAPLGDGTYVYTGLSFFRQLPAGVPGAIRLFVNLLALGRG